MATNNWEAEGSLRAASPTRRIVLISLTHEKAYWRAAFRARLELRRAGGECCRGAHPQRRNFARGEQPGDRAGSRESARARNRSARDSVEGPGARGLRPAGGCSAPGETRGSRLPCGIHAAAFAVFRGTISAAHSE